MHWEDEEKRKAEAADHNRSVQQKAHLHKQTKNLPQSYWVKDQILKKITHRQKADQLHSLQMFMCIDIKIWIEFYS